MANLLDNAIQQHLLNFKANAANNLIVGARPQAAPQPPQNHARAPGFAWAPTPLQSPSLGISPAPGSPLAPPQGVMLSVAIDNLPFRYCFTDNDMRETFGKWGPLQSVQVIREGAREVGVVHYEDPVDAADAQRQLQGHAWMFEGATGTLSVVFGGPEQLLSLPSGRPTPLPAGGPSSASGPPLNFGAQQVVMRPSGPPGGPAPTGPLPGGPPPGGPTLGGPPPAPMPPQNSLLGCSGAMPKSLPMSMPPAAGIGPGLGDSGSGLGQPGASPMSSPASASGPGFIAGPGASPALGTGHTAVTGLPGGKGDIGMSKSIDGAASNGWSSGAPAAAKPPWSCKVVIQSETLHNDFPTVQKIIGANSANVEHVRSQTLCAVQLRGRGSNHLEPETGQELQESMFLYLTSASPENGKAALDMVQDLLKSVYEEHQGWCLQHNLASPALGDPIVIENPDIIASPGLPPHAQAAPPPAPGGQGCDFYGAACRSGGARQDFRPGPYNGGKGP